MDDLFRFMVLRAAAPVSGATDLLTFSPGAVALAGVGQAPNAKRVATLVHGDPRFAKAPTDLPDANAVAGLTKHLGSGPWPASKVREVIEAETGRSAADLSGDSRFQSDMDRLGDSLLAIKILSDGTGVDIGALVSLRKACALVIQSVNTEGEMDWPAIVFDPAARPEPVPGPEPKAPADDTAKTHDRLVNEIAAIDGALAFASNLKAADFVGKPASRPRQPAQTDVERYGGGALAKDMGASVFRIAASTVRCKRCGRATPIGCGRRGLGS
jgi:hypothetical protein